MDRRRRNQQPNTPTTNNLTMHSFITHNLITLLERGAFNQPKAEARLLPMSPHKWRKLVDAAASLNILRFVARGAEIMRDDKAFSPTLTAAITARHGGKDEVPFDYSNAHLFNHWTQKKLDEVREEEMNSHNTSDETLTLLDIIIKNTEHIVTKDTSIEGIITMGQYVREQREMIDYDKLRLWLAYIGLVQIASVEGNMLISCMGFEAEELPFVIKPYHKAKHLFMNSITKVFGKHSFSTMTRMNIAMLETISHRFVSAISLVTDIEE